MITLSKREAKYGGHVNVRPEFHGDEKVPACDVSVSAVMLQSHELDALLGAGAYDRLFAVNGEGLPEPALPDLDQRRTIREKYEGARVTLYLGLIPTEVVLAPAKLKSITLEPKVGGLTELSATIQATPDPKWLEPLAAFMATDISLEIVDAKRAAKAGDGQRQLPLDANASGQQAAA